MHLPPTSRAAGVTLPGRAQPMCRPIAIATGTPGAQDYTERVSDVRVCAPAPPDCGPWGWLEESDFVTIAGEACASSQPDPARLQPPPAPTCEDLGYPTTDKPKAGGCGCTAAGRAHPTGPWAALALLFGLALALRRRMRA
jgi:MYXO-CTERM domain-containing protein